MNLYKLLLDFLRRVAFSQRTVTVVEPVWYRWMAALTGVLAAMAGFLVVHAGNLANQAMIDSSLSTRAQTKASDAWSEYQANSIKARIVETAMLECNELNKPKLLSDVHRFRDRQPALKDKAEFEERKAEEYGSDVAERMKERARLTYAMVAIQSAIGICSIAVVSKRNSAFVLSVLVSLIGIGITAFAVFFK